jgi:allophanate hydrolase subunit 2
MHHDTAFAVKAGQVLRFDFPKDGARTYLAVAGGIDVPLVLGSRSTYTLGALGGFQGRRLAVDDLLPIGVPSGKGRAGASLPMALRQSLGGEVYLRVVPGLYYERLTEFAATSFFSESWTVGSEPHRLSLQGRQGADFSATGTAIRGRFRSIEYRRQLLPDRLDSGSGRAGAHCVTPRRGVWWRLRHDRHRDQRRP